MSRKKKNRPFEAGKKDEAPPKSDLEEKITDRMKPIAIPGFPAPPIVPAPAAPEPPAPPVEPPTPELTEAEKEQPHNRDPEDLLDDPARGFCPLFATNFPCAGQKCEWFDNELGRCAIHNR